MTKLTGVFHAVVMNKKRFASGAVKTVITVNSAGRLISVVCWDAELATSLCAIKIGAAVELNL